MKRTIILLLILLLGSCASTPDPELKKSEAKSTLPGRLPEGFDKAFLIPTPDKDQHGNPVITRNGSRAAPATGYPYEIWMKSPRMEFVLVPAGEFMMGSPDSEAWRLSDEGPVHRVRIANPYYLAKYEVTRGQWEAVMGSNPSSCKEPGGNAPVERVSWDDCQAFCKKAGLSLPSEAQWEYACRAETKTRFSSGDIYLDRSGWYAADSGTTTHPVGKKEPNAWGLYDMHGNVWEWCEDEYHANYQGSPADGSAWLGGSSDRVCRGGSWFSGAPACRSSRRGGGVPSRRIATLGFRPSKSLP